MAGRGVMRAGAPVFRMLGLLGRAIAGGLVYIFGVMLGGAITSSLGMPILAPLTELSPATLLLSSFASGTILGLVFGLLAVRLALPRFQLISVLFVLLLILNAGINALEAFFFTTATAEELASGVLTSAFGHLVLAVFIGLSFPPEAPRADFWGSLRQAIRRRARLDWLWRFSLASVLYLPVYWIFGLAAYAAVGSYYEDAALELGLALRAPGAGVVVPLELIRGLIFALTLFPVALLIRRRGTGLAIWIALVIAASGAWAPMVQASWLPPVMRLTHGMELTATAIVQGGVIAWLFAPPAVGAGWRREGFIKEPVG